VDAIRAIEGPVENKFWNTDGGVSSLEIIETL
jgi:hypothetical protein